MTLSITGTVIMVVVIALAVALMVLVLARANRSNQDVRHDRHREEHADARYPGMDPEAVQRHAELVGDDVEQSVEPGGHVIRESDH
jgi:hypothetical protein